MRTLFLTQTDARGASARLRVYQFLAPLARLGIKAEVWPLPFGTFTSNSCIVRGGLHALHVARRLLDIPRVRAFDAIVIQRDLVAHIHPWLERAMARVNPGIVIDVDDSIHLHPPGRPPAWPFRLLWDPEKLAGLVRVAAQVVVANRFLREEVARVGVQAMVIPTSIDTERWSPGGVEGDGPLADRRFVIGWIGSPGTTGYLEALAPALSRVSREMPCVLRAVGAYAGLAQKLSSTAPDLEVETLPWTVENEVAAVRGFDVGVMPLSDDRWSRGKSATKLLQYMACGIPAVASPVGANADIIKDGVNGLLAGNTEAWVGGLLRLARDPRLRVRLGREGRATIVAEYDVRVSAPRLAMAIRQAGRRGRTGGTARGITRGMARGMARGMGG